MKKNILQIVLLPILVQTLFSETLDPIQGITTLTLNIVTEPLPFTFTHPSLSIENSIQGEHDVIAESETNLVIDGVNLDGNVDYRIEFSGFTVGALPYGGQGIILKNSSEDVEDQVIGGVIKSITWTGFGDLDKTVPISSSTMQSEGCSLTYLPITGDGVSINFGLSSICTLTLSAEQLQTLHGESVTALIDISQHAIPDLYSTTINVTISEI